MRTRKEPCWCGGSLPAVWNRDYAYCPVCGTLGSVLPAPGGGGEGEFYDETYWTERKSAAYADMGPKNLVDIVLLHYRERAAYWMQHMLRHVKAGSRVFEIGCGMGSMLRWLLDLGFDAAGSELSPSWRRWLNERLGIPVMAPENMVSHAAGRPFDCVIMMDVLEHLPDPRGDLERIAATMRPDGVLMLQLPEYPDGASYKELLAKDAPFLRHLNAGEHVFLYSERALHRLLAECGFTHTLRYPAIFRGDMFIFAGREPLPVIAEDESEAAILANPRHISAYAALKNEMILRAALRRPGSGAAVRREP